MYLLHIYAYPYKHTYTVGIDGPNSQAQQGLMQQVTFNIEYLSEYATRVILSGLQTAAAVSLTLFVAGCSLELSLSDGSSAALRPTVYLNIVFANICLAVLLLAFGYQCLRIVLVLKHKQRWSARRKRNLWVRVAETAVQLCNLSCFLLQNVVALSPVSIMLSDCVVLVRLPKAPH